MSSPNEQEFSIKEEVMEEQNPVFDKFKFSKIF